MKNTTISITGLMLLSAVCVLADSQCPAIEGSERARLINYVQKKYNVPATKIAVTELSSVGSTCYRQLRFKSEDPKVAFRVDLFVSPDLRFLARDLMDSHLDPIAEERRKREAFNAGLLSGNSPVLGPEKAPVTLVVFSDFQCPFCARASVLFREVLATEHDRVRLVYRYLPLPMHPWARAAAEAAACTQQQGNDQFWPLHDFLFEHQRELTTENLIARLMERSKNLEHFDAGKFLSCLAERKTAPLVEQDMAFAAENGIHATPTAFLNGRQIQLVAPEQLRTLIKQLSADPQAIVPSMERHATAGAPSPAECAAPAKP